MKASETKKEENTILCAALNKSAEVPMSLLIDD